MAQPSPSGAGGTVPPGGIGGVSGGPGMGPTPGASGYVTALAPLAHLNQAQYLNSITDATGGLAVGSKKFPEEEGVANGAVTAAFVRRYWDAADEVASSLLPKLGQLMGCQPAQPAQEQACIDGFVASFGRLTHRRPLLADERDRALSLFADARKVGSFTEATRDVIAFLLQSSGFLYRLEKAGADGMLDAQSLATRLSFLLTNGPPDALLSAAAGSGELTGRLEALRMHGKRLMATPRGKAAVVALFRDWLRYQDVLVVQRTSKTFNEDVARDMVAATDAFASDLFFGAKTFGDLFTSSSTFVNERLGKVLGLTGITGMDFRKMMLSNTGGALSGVLTQPSVLTLHAHDGEASPIKRGLYVRRRLLCQIIKAPPDVSVQEEDLSRDLPQRQRLAEHGASPVCQGCHNLIDPIGFGFENYDHLGRWIVEEKTAKGVFPLTGAGKLSGTDRDGPFRGVGELAAKLATSETARRCLAEAWLGFAVGRRLGPGDVSSLDGMVAALSTSDGRLDAALQKLVETPSFTSATYLANPEER